MSHSLLPLIGEAPRTKREPASPQRERVLTRGENRDFRAEIGRAIGRMLQLANLSVKEAAALLGMSDHAQLSRWIAGTERPLFDRIFSVEQLRGPLVVALAEMAKDRVEVTTQITVRVVA